MNKPSLGKQSFITILLICISSLSFAYDRAHFYSTNPLWPEPRFEKKFLSSFDVVFFGGKSSQSQRCDGCNKNLLDIYGTHNMHLLGQGVPGKNLNLFTDITLTELAQIPSCNDFGHLSFCGRFSTKQFIFTYRQNFKHGIFCTIDTPIRTLTIKNTGYTDLSPNEPNVPNKNNPIWKAFLLQFNTILKQYNLDAGCYDKTHIGDTSLLIGWTKNYEDTEVLDFVDTTVQTGILLPTGEKRNPDKIFSLPHGYDGHVGIPFIFDMAFGFYEWLTFEFHFDALMLLQKTKSLRLKTAFDQSGFIKLAKGQANVCPGIITNIGGYIQADHFAGGLSCTLGYSFSSKGNDTLEPCNSYIFNKNIINSDEMLKKWKRHTLHLKAEYDFTEKDDRFGPRISFFYNWHLSGKRTFKTHTGGFGFGLDIALKM